MKNVEAILLPGPVVTAHTIAIRSETTDHRGHDVTKRAKIRGDGRGVVQVVEYLNAHYSAWHKFLGCEILVDWCGKGESHYILDESWAVMTLESAA